MQNQIKTETRLAFIQFVFSSFFSEINMEEEINNFENYFYKLSVPSIEKNKETMIKFNKNYFKKLATNYNYFVKNNDIESIIDSYLQFGRKFKKWEIINKSIILCIISEIQIIKKNKVKILLNDYLNISKSLINKKELGMLNAITDKYLNDKKII